MVVGVIANLWNVTKNTKAFSQAISMIGGYDACLIYGWLDLGNLQERLKLL
jgi:hypothetical protein